MYTYKYQQIHSSTCIYKQIYTGGLGGNNQIMSARSDSDGAGAAAHYYRRAGDRSRRGPTVTVTTTTTSTTTVTSSARDALAAAPPTATVTGTVTELDSDFGRLVSESSLQVVNLMGIVCKLVVVLVCVPLASLSVWAGGPAPGPAAAVWALPLRLPTGLAP